LFKTEDKVAPRTVPQIVNVTAVTIIAVIIFFCKDNDEGVFVSVCCNLK
jgi:hypothetical protein